mgnify:CR=1 FL=1
MLAHSPEALALLVKSQRKQLNLSQAEIADRVGLKQKTISAFENHPEGTQLSTLFRILAAAHLDIYAIDKDRDISSLSGWKEEW